MPEDEGPIHAPEFPPQTTWLQGGPLKLADQRGKVLLIDFWDYTCVNCLHTLPYVKEWHRRYGSLGLVVVGVHAPEFSFARESGNVLRAVREDRKSTRLNSSHSQISYAVFCLKKKKKK